METRSAELRREAVFMLGVDGGTLIESAELQKLLPAPHEKGGATAQGGPGTIDYRPSVTRLVETNTSAAAAVLIAQAKA
jgi:hypothetical protein